MQAILILLVLAAFAYDAADYVTPDKSPMDTRKYRMLTLENELKVLLVEDMDADKSAAAMDVGVGSLDDPPNIQGLAHYLEHMLFLGSKAYPGRDDFGSYLASSAGFSNAYTAGERTNYHFEVARDGFEQALRIWSHFFIDPLFDASRAEDEKAAVNAEFKRNLRNDDWRLYTMFKESAAPGSAYHHFSTGSTETLSPAGVDVRAELLAFHAQHYVAPRMTLTLVSGHSLEQMTTWATQMFAAVSRAPPAATPSVPRYNVTAFPLARLGKYYLIAPIMDIRRLSLVFPLVDPVPHFVYRAKAVQYVSHFLGHEGKGSLYAYLRHERQWISALSVALEEQLHAFDLLRVELTLTQAGDAAVDAIIGAFYQYVTQLGLHGVTQAYFDELASLANVSFTYAERGSAYETARALAAALQEYRAAPRDVLTAPRLFWTFDEQLVRHGVLLRLLPHNMNVFHESRRFKASELTATEPWFGVRYGVVDVERARQQAWETATTPIASLHLPAANAFVPTDFALRQPSAASAAQRGPTTLANTTAQLLLLKTDDVFKRPKAVVYVDVLTPVAGRAPDEAVGTALLVRALRANLSQDVYPATLAGLSYSLDVDQLRGVRMRFAGYSDTLPALIELVTDRLASFEPNAALMATVLDDLARDYRNWYAQPPLQQALDERHRFTVAPHAWTVTEREAALANIRVGQSPEEVAADAIAAAMDARDELLEVGRLECLYYGNVDERTAQATTTKIANALALRIPADAQLPAPRHVRFPDASAHAYRRLAAANESNAAVIVYYQFGAMTRREALLLDVVLPVLQQRAFDQLRTVEKLGYVATAAARTTLNVGGFWFFIQSATRDALHLDGRVLAFVEQVWRPLMESALDAATWSAWLTAGAARVAQRSQSLAEEASRVWVEVETRSFDFDRVARDVATVHSLRVEELRAMCGRRLYADAPLRRRFAWHVFANADGRQSLSAVTAAAADDESARVAAELSVVVDDAAAARFVQQLELYGTPGSAAPRLAAEAAAAAAGDADALVRVNGGVAAHDGCTGALTLLGVLLGLSLLALGYFLYKAYRRARRRARSRGRPFFKLADWISTPLEEASGDASDDAESSQSRRRKRDGKRLK